jgi:hypothetical protein
MFKGPKEREHYFYIIATIIVGGLSVAIIAYNTRTNVNMHHIPDLLFLILRMPLFLMRNFTGFEHWVDTYQSLPFYTHQPLVVFEAPRWISSISSIRQIGIYEWNFVNITRTMKLILSLFGTAPTILFYFIRRKRSELISSSLPFNTILFSGCMLFILAPCLGPASYRYYINAWPVFFLIVPFLLDRVRKVDRKVFMMIMACYVFSAWLPVFPFKAAKLAFSVPLIIIEVILHGYTWHMLSVVSKKFSILKEEQCPFR